MEYSRLVVLLSCRTSTEDTHSASFIDGRWRRHSHGSCSNPSRRGIGSVACSSHVLHFGDAQQDGHRSAPPSPRVRTSSRGNGFTIGAFALAPKGWDLSSCRVAGDYRYSCSSVLHRILQRVCGWASQRLQISTRFKPRLGT